MSYKVKKVYTDNPYVDEIVYYSKLLAVGTILKNEQLALSYETLQIVKASDIYMACVEGRAIFEIFDKFPIDVLYKAGINPSMIDECVADKNKIPESRRPIVVKEMMSWYISNYEEYNDYYRMLTGLPPMGYEDIYVTEWDIPNNVVIDITVPIHKMKKQDVSILRKFGIVDEIIAEDPANRKFINYIGLDISLYKARKAERFAVLYIPPVENTTIRDMYIDKIEVLRLYTLRTVYSEAFKYGSDYYDSFIACFIVIETMIDLIVRVQEFVARKEIFDIRTVQYIFESYGIEYFDNIPLKYQIRLVKNLHQLLKVKSTKRCMIDICSLFGFENITVFKYYLLKDRNTTIDGDIEYHYKTITDEYGNEKVVEDVEKNYTLRFFKLPIDDDVDTNIRNQSNYIDYDDLTYSDDKWDGGLEHNVVKREILEREFNYTRSKYISIDTVYDIAKISTQQSYFFNILYDNVYLEDQVRVVVPFINPTDEIRVSDLFTFLNTLTYVYYGIADDIMDTQGKILHVNGFDFRANLQDLASIIDLNAYKNTENIGQQARDALDKFDIPNSSLLSMNQLMELFVNNLDIRDVLIQGMYEADNKRIYDIYHTLYTSLMEMELTMDYYKNPITGDFYRDEDGHATLSEFLKHRNSTLYGIIEEVRTGFDDTESKVQYISSIIDNIVYVLEEFIDTREYQGLFYNLPVVSAEAVKEYVAQVINFFKSFKVTFLGLNTTYILDDKFEGILKIIDDAELYINYTKPDYINLREYISKIKVNLTKDEKIHLDEITRFDISTFTNMHVMQDGMIQRDDVTKLSKIGGIDGIELGEGFAIGKVHLGPDDIISLADGATRKTRFDFSHDLGIEERIYIERV